MPHRAIRALLIPALALAAALPGAQNSAAAALADRTRSGAPGEILRVEQAFVPSTVWTGERSLTVRWDIAEGYYLYRDQLEITGPGVQSAPTPAGVVKQDPYFDGPLEVYYGSVGVPVRLAENAGGDAPLMLRWQGCAEDVLCYPPQSAALRWAAPQQPVEIELLGIPSAPRTAAAAGPAPSVAEDQQLAQQLGSGGLLWNLIVFFGLGLLLALTPCVLPMVPILSSLIVGAGEISRARSLALSLTYVLPMALTYALAGVAAAYFGTNLQAVLQTPWVLWSFSALFVLLGLSMFGLYEIQVPQRLQTWLSYQSDRAQGGSLVGAAGMGLLSALIVGPCVAPPLVGALIYITQSGDMALGGLALLALGLGMGAPLVLVGALLGSVLPRVGAWMEQIKWLFGFVLFGLALWFIERVVDADTAALLWGALLCLAAAWLLMGERADSAGAGEAGEAGPAGIFRNSAGPRTAAAMRLLGLVRPAAGLAALVWALLFFAQSAGGAGLGLAASASAGGGLITVRSAAELDAVLERQDDPVVLDFYADWCIECRAMEAEILPRPDVRAALSGWVFVKADVTENSPANQTLLDRYGVLGPPTVLFFNGADAELRALRITGAPSAEQLIQILERARSP